MPRLPYRLPVEAVMLVETTVFRRNHRPKNRARKLFRRDEGVAELQLLAGSFRLRDPHPHPSGGVGIVPFQPPDLRGRHRQHQKSQRCQRHHDLADQSFPADGSDVSEPAWDGFRAASRCGSFFHAEKPSVEEGERLS